MRPVFHAIVGLLLTTLVLKPFAMAQHPWQKPSPRMKRADVEKLIGKYDKKPWAQSHHIVWVWGYDRGHRPGNHDYTRARDLMVSLLRKVPKLTIETAYLFPTKEQLDRAHLVIMYLHLPGLERKHYAILDPYLKRGGGLVAIHETMIQRPRARGEQWADRIGLAWSEGKSQWGALFTRIFADTQHPIFRNFSSRINLVDEFYWHLARAREKDDQQTIATVPIGPPGHSRGPVSPEKLSKERYPVFWTMTHNKGRIFCSLPGHNTFLFYDPKFRIILLRGIAWTLQEKPDPLMPLVFHGIEQNGLVGTTDTMRKWSKKPRSLKDDGFPAGTPPEAVNKAINARLGLPVTKSLPRPRVKHIIDTHIHLYDTTRKNGVPWPPREDKVLYKPHLPTEFQKVAKPSGVTGAVVVEASDRLEDNEWVLNLVKNEPFFLALVGNIDPYRKDFAAHLSRLKRDPRFVGIRARVQGKKINYRDTRVMANFRLLAKADLTLDILMNGEGVETIHEIDRLAGAIPRLRIIVNHVLGYNIDGSPPPEKWKAAVKRLARNPNVHVKISGLYQRCTIQPATKDLKHYHSLLDILWKNFGAKRLLYGSNWPCTKKSGDYASFVKLVTSYFQDKGGDGELYFWKNAARVYRLKLPGPSTNQQNHE